MVSSEKPFSRSFRIASRVVSTWAKMPRTEAMAMLVASPVRMLQGMRQHFLDLHDGQRRHDADEAQEEEEEPREGADDDGGVGHRRIVRAPGVRVEVEAESEDDDVEALEPHAHEDEEGDDVERGDVRARLPPEEDEGHHAVAEVLQPEGP